MILILGSSRRAASQSVETSGSSVGDVMGAMLPAFSVPVMAGLDPAIQHSKKSTVRNDVHAHRTNSFIAASRPAIVIGNMRCENSRRMMVVDSE